jgi:tRNA threonylcarbamoyladenosine biosynthesis protein TsaB
MKILALDTSDLAASVAILEDGKVISSYSFSHQKTHSQRLLGMVQRVLLDIGCKPQEMDVLAVSVGPGSFTGLRIGVTTIKAMGYALKKPVIGINTLDALANRVLPEGTLICPMMDARNRQVFTSFSIPFLKYLSNKKSCEPAKSSGFSYFF